MTVAVAAGGSTALAVRVGLTTRATTTVREALVGITGVCVGFTALIADLLEVTAVEATVAVTSGLSI